MNQCKFCARELQPEDDSWCSQQCFEDWLDHIEGTESEYRK